MFAITSAIPRNRDFPQAMTSEGVGVSATPGVCAATLAPDLRNGPGRVLIHLKSNHGVVFLGRSSHGVYQNKVEALTPGARAELKKK